MFKSTSRGQRSKGVKAKHILQICLLIGVCFWLIYQVKHSHNKRKELDNGEARISIKELDKSIKKFGRKYLHPHEEHVTGNQKPNEEDEEEEDAMIEDDNKHLVEEHEVEKNKHFAEEGEVEENEHEEEEHKYEEHEDEENKHEEEQDEKGNARDEGRGDGGDELDEHDQEREGDIDREEGFLNEEKEREEENDEIDGKENEENEREEDENENDEIGGKENKEKEREEDENGEIDEKENKEKEREDDENDESDRNEEKEREDDDNDESDRKDNDVKEGNFENESSESQDHADDSNNNHEAREEHYKGDNASSEVAHDAQSEPRNGEKSTTNNLIENRERTTSEQDDKSNNHAFSTQNVSGVKLGEVALTENENPLNVLSKEETDEVDSSISVNSSLAKSTNTSQLIDLPEARNTSVPVTTGVFFNSSDAKTIFSQLNETGALSGVSLAQKVNPDGAITEENSKLLSIEPKLTNSGNLTLNSNNSISNITMVTKTENTENMIPSSSVNTTESTASKKIMSPDTTVKVVESSNSTAMKENADALPYQESNSNEEFGQKIESKDTTSTENLDAVQDDAIDSSDSSISQDEKEVHFDLDTLPVAESNKIEDVSAE